MSRLDELIAELCPDGVEYFQLKTLCTRQKGTSITAGEMKTLDKPNAPIRIFAGGNTTAYVEYGDIPDSAVITKPSIIVKSRGNIGFEYNIHIFPYFYNTLLTNAFAHCEQGRFLFQNPNRGSIFHRRAEKKNNRALPKDKC